MAPLHQSEFLREIEKITETEAFSSVLEVFLRGRDAGLSDKQEEWRHLEEPALSKLKRYCEVFTVGNMLGWLVDQDIEPHVSVIDKSTRNTILLYWSDARADI